MADGDQDVVATLKRQHEEVKGLLGDVAAKTGGERAEPFARLVHLLAVHETGEEEVVHPMVKQISTEGAEIVARHLAEEDEAKTVLGNLEKIGPDDAAFGAKFQSFQAAVLAHATSEEQEEFPLLESISPEARQRLSTMLATAEHLAPTHPHPHGPESAVGNMMVGPFVAIVDKVRDALRDR